MKTFLINDTSKYHFGTRMVIRTIEEQLEARGVELVGRSPSKHTFRRYKPILDTVDLVIVNGEGSLHGGRRRDLLDVALEYPCALINFSISDYNNFPLKAARSFKYVAARESISAANWNRWSGKWWDYKKGSVDVVPELSLMQDVRPVDELPEPVTALFDSVETPNIDRSKWISPFDEDFVTDAQIFSHWVTGRLHVVCLAIILNKAFSAYDTHTHKIRGLMKDAGLGDRFFATREEAFENIPDKPSDSQGEYLEHARKRIPEMFDEICSL